MLTTRYKTLLNRFLAPLGRAVARSGISPSAITRATPLLAALTCLWVLRTRAVLPFCLLIAAVGCLDGLDGAVARAGGRVTKFGAYLDAMCDRIFEALVALTAAALTGYWTLAMAVLIGSLLISYAKARAAMEVPVSNQEWPDLMERTERGIVFVGGLAAGALCPWRPLGQGLFWWTLVVLNALIYATLIQRVLRARRLIEARSGR